MIQRNDKNDYVNSFIPPNDGNNNNDNQTFEPFNDEEDIDDAYDEWSYIEEAREDVIVLSRLGLI